MSSRRDDDRVGWLSPGHRFADFEVLGLLGRGSYASVYRVRRGAEDFAMKVLAPAVTPVPGARSLRREAALLTCIGHPGVARVHEVGDHAGSSYLVMDLVDGRTLADLLTEGPTTIDLLLSVATDLASTLAAVHRVGVVHRDLKPGNVVMDGHRARLVDFSLAARSGVTGAGAAGTMLYCAPEQSGMLDRPVDGRADLYALGAVLYECATGTPPFTSPSVGELLRLHATTPVPDPRAVRPDLPPALAGIIGRLLAKDPDDRYPDCTDVLADLRRHAGAAVDVAGGTDPGAPSGAVGSGAAGQLVGRSAELAALVARWERAREGEGGAALIAGSAGGGKTRLAAELAATAAAAGAVVLTGKSDADESIPLAALRHAVDSHVRWIRSLPADEARPATARLRSAAGRAGSLLGGISPALGDLLGVGTPVEDDTDQPLAAAAVGFLITLARSAGGAVLCLDDVQWLDEATRGILRRLTTELDDAPLLLIATARNDAASTAAVSSLRSCLGDALDLTVSLEPLPAPAVGELVAGAAGGLRLDAHAATALATHSDGNPFVVLECLPAIIDAGLLRPSWGTWSIDADGLRDLDLSADIGALILDRLDGLDAGSRRLLAMGAVIGPRFSPDLVAEVRGCELPHARDVAGAAVWHRLLEAGPDGGYVFLHDRIREALLACFDADELRDVHARIADALDRRADRGPETVYALARHCQLAGTAHDPARTFHACTEAGRLALADHVPAEALSFLDSAADAAARAGIPLGSDFHQRRGTAQLGAGLLDDAIASLEQAHELAADPLERARILGLIARVHDSAWSTDEQAATVDRALAELGAPLPRNRLVRLVTTLALFSAGVVIRLTRLGHGTVRGTKRERYRLLVTLHDAAALAHARQFALTTSLELALREMYWVARLGPGAESARMDIANAHLAHAAGREGLARLCTRLARSAADEVGDPRLTAYVEWLWSNDRIFFGIDQGESARQVYAAQARWLDVGKAGDILLVLHWNALLRGDLADAENVWARRMALVAASGQTGRITVHSSEACLLALQGQALAAVTHLRRMRAARYLLRFERVDIALATMMVAVEQHELGALFDDAAAEFDALGVKVLDLIPAEWCVYAYQAYGRLEQCRVASPGQRAARLSQARAAVRQLRRAARTPLLEAHHRVASAALAQVSGRHVAALAALDRAEPVLRRADAPLVAFEAARVRAHALRALDVEGEAHRQASYALSLAVEQRWPHRAQRVEKEFDLDAGAERVSVGHTSSDAVALGRYRQRLDAITQVGLAASQALDPVRLTAIALDETIRILGAERAYLFLVDDHSGQLVDAGGRDAHGRDLGAPTGHSSTLVERVRHSREPLVVTGTDEGEALGAHSVVLHDLRSVMVAPLLCDGRLAGVVYLDSRVAKGIFTDDDVGILVAITNHIVVALETAKTAQLEAAVARANQQRDLADTMRDALASISGSLHPDQVLRRLLATVLRLTGADHAWLVVIDGGESTLRAMTARAGSPDDGDLDPGADRPAFAVLDPTERLTRLLEATEPVAGTSSNRPELLEGCGEVGTWLAIPLVTRGRRLGIIALATGRRGAYSDGQTDLAVALIDQGLIAYENASLFAQVQHLAATDGLTGVANRRHFRELAEQALALARRHHRPLAAMMIDVDNFKSVNDGYGHRVGDEVLCGIAVGLTGSGRDQDLVGRYGGEEFAVVLFADDDVIAAAERLRQTIAGTPIPTAGGPVPVTISIGLAHLRASDGTVDDLLERADDCLYRAKRAGRNRVVTDRAAMPATGRAGERETARGGDS